MLFCEEKEICDYVFLQGVSVISGKKNMMMTMILN